jgi:hypothetical protein
MIRLVQDQAYFDSLVVNSALQKRGIRSAIENEKASMSQNLAGKIEPFKWPTARQ